MAKTTTVTTTKTATKAATTKTKKATGEKQKREPSAYNLFVKSKMTEWKEANPDKPHKEAMGAIAVMWREAPENPNRGKEPAAKAAPKAKKAKAKPKPKATREATTDDEDVSSEAAPSSEA